MNISSDLNVWTSVVRDLEVGALTFDLYFERVRSEQVGRLGAGPAPHKGAGSIRLPVRGVEEAINGIGEDVGIDTLQSALGASALLDAVLEYQCDIREDAVRY